MMKIIGSIAFAVLLWALVHGIGGAMWDMADGQELWWNGEERSDDADDER